MKQTDMHNEIRLQSYVDMNTEEFISFLSEYDIRISLNGNDLKCNGPKDVLSSKIKAEITLRKEEIVNNLKGKLYKSSGVTEILKAPRQDYMPLSFAQQRFWFLQKLDPQNPVYNITASRFINGNIDLPILKQGINMLSTLHEILRTIIIERDGIPAQMVTNEQLALEVIDLEHFPVNFRYAEFVKWREGEARKPFLLEKPMVRVTLVRLGDQVNHLTLSMHHIISDGWSLGIFFRQLDEIYQNISNGNTVSIDIPLQYADYAWWEQKSFNKKNNKRHIDYWGKKLFGINTLLDLPTDRPRSPIQSSNGAVQAFHFSQELSTELKALSIKFGVTLFMTLLAIFKILLYRYTSQNDIVVGAPTANRNLRELEPLIGLFVNTMVLRTDLDENPTVINLLKRVRNVVIEANEHQEFPFEKIVELLQPDRSLSHSPLFQVMFALQNTPGSLEYEAISAGAMFDLSIYIWVKDNNIIGSVEYNCDLFDRETITRMIDHYITLANSAVERPGQCISDLPILTSVEKSQLLVWNQTDKDYPKAQCYHQLFAEQAQRTPEATAIICGDAKLSYKELNSRANQVARYLRRLGAGPGNVVGIYVDRTLDMAVGLLGILKAGSAYTPLDPSFPKDRIEYMLEDCNAGLLLTQKELSDNIKDFSGVKVSIDADWNKIAEEDSSDLVIQANSENLAYIIYTSGSTGKPKGVQISHRALNNFLYSMMETPGATPQDTILSVTTMSFDIFGLELFMPLLNGGRVVIAEREDRLDGKKLVALIEKHGVTIMQATPSTWRIMLEAGWTGKKGLKILCGGEAFPKDLIDPLLERCDELWNMYGPTETTIWSTIFRIESSKTPILVGLPIGNTQTYILDQNLHPLPVGLVGELHIGGDGLSHGYLNRPDLTAEKFIPNPFSNDPAALMYKTGDLARYRSDGMIECLGRVDNQVKLRGFRIELGEIEARIKDVESVQNSVVVIREDHPGEKRLVAYYVARENQKVSITDLTGYLRTKLPEYMVPRQFVSLEKIPLTPNGKIDLRQLADVKVEPIEQFPNELPHTEMELCLAQIWRELLELDTISVHDNFFDIGGHSLLSIQVITRLEKEIGVRINPGEFTYQTLGQMATSIEKQIGLNATSSSARERNKLFNIIKNRIARFARRE